MASGAANRYAQAVLSLAKEQNTMAQWQADLALLNDVASDRSSGRVSQESERSE